MLEPDAPTGPDDDPLELLEPEEPEEEPPPPDVPPPPDEPDEAVAVPLLVRGTA
jgi:hypothetical protein